MLNAQNSNVSQIYECFGASTNSSEQDVLFLFYLWLLRSNHFLMQQPWGGVRSQHIEFSYSDASLTQASGVGGSMLGRPFCIGSIMK